jgi:hypothetical protein
MLIQRQLPADIYENNYIIALTFMLPIFSLLKMKLVSQEHGWIIYQ